jgi:HPt (histidine-containing phosphotransfer) domain-containing protein
MKLEIDLSYLESMAAGDNNLIKEMIEIFKEQVPEFIEEMKNALNNNDFKSLSSVAHKAKSSVAIMGITTLTEELKTLESIAANNERNEEYHSFVDSFISNTNEAIKLLDNISAKL